MSKLTIYKASAGSGKTFTLTQEYLKIIFRNTSSYRNILAVTFTNKAANEMKTRILKEVNTIAKDEKSQHIDKIIEFTGKPKEQIIKDAIEIQNNLLHNYSFFSVKTIDSFFQEIIKSFTKEIGLQMGFQLELDSSEVLDKAIDKVIDSIEKEKEIRQWFLSFAKDKIRDGKRWNFKNEIADFSKEIFKEKFTQHKTELEEKLKNRKFLSDFKTELNKQKKEIENEYKEIGEKAVTLIESYGLELSDLAYGKSGFANYFYKFKSGDFAEPSKRILDAQNNVEKWYSRTSTKKDTIEALFINGGNELLINAVEFYQNKIDAYNSLTVVASLINVFGIITDISRAVSDISSEENLFLISYAAPFINAIIDENESPFIYEKIGARYKYYMIDEFQDTSAIQWNNFKPLIADNLAEGNNSLIVGDVKQSIYRWRNSDWKLLSEGIYNDFHKDYIKNVTLENNYRSKKEIILFNNKIFTKGKEILQNAFNDIISNNPSDLSKLEEKIINAYSANEQNFPGNNKGSGYVYYQKILKEGNDQTMDILEKIPDILIEIQDKGFKLKDVAFLVRTKLEGAEIVNYLMQYKNENHDSEYNFNVISSEALFIGNSPVIKLLIALLKDISSQKEELNRIFINYEYEIYLKENKEIDLHDIFSNKNTKIEKYDNIKPNLLSLSFYEIIEKLTSIFELNKNPDNFIYLQAFNDLIKDFSTKRNINIVDFLEWWEEKGHLSSVSVNENQDAAQILTIHKSKGLEFKIVIIPFADWDLNKSGEILWTKNNNSPFNKINILPVKYSSTIEKSFFYKDYYNELLQQYVDNLNLAYVAFTRAEHALYIFSRAGSKENSKKKKETGIKDIGELLFSIVEHKANDNIYKYGTFEENKEEREHTENYKLEEYLADKSPESLNIKYNSRNFFSSDTKEKINKGLLYHKIFENIIQISDIEDAVQKLINEGEVSQIEKENFVNEIRKLIKNLNVEHWFDGRTYKVRNETSILYKNEVKRPDRLMFADNEVIVVDYKFGDKEHSSYKKQLEDYKEIIKNMGYQNIKSYIWYVNKNNIVEV